MAETLNSLADLKDAAIAAGGSEAPVHVQKLDKLGRAYATGKRKNAVARVWIKPGKGEATINGKPLDVYFARPDSNIDKISVYRARMRMGERLAEKIRRVHPEHDIEVVIPIPDTSRTSALQVAQLLGIKYREGFNKNRYIGRTFIEPTQAIRDFGVKLKLNPVRRMLEGQRVVLVDDSIVRGTTSRKIVRLVRDAGATEVHVRISCPPTISPCYYGVDTPRREELIAANHSIEEIRKYLGADSLGYVSLEGLRMAVEEN